MSQAQQVHHDLARLTIRVLLAQTLEGMSVRLAREELITVYEVQQRHRFAAQRVDHVAVVNDIAMLAIGPARPRTKVISRVAPTCSSSRSS
jgi:hypothetical protein